MTVLVLDSGGLSELATSAARLAALREEGLWPPQVTSVVLVEALTGDRRRDFHRNRLLRACEIGDVTELAARAAAALRARTGRAAEISAVDAVVVAHAAAAPGQAVVLTTDPRDIGDLAAAAARPLTVVAV